MQTYKQYSRWILGGLLLGAARSAVGASAPIIGKASNKCLDLSGTRRAPGTGLVISPCRGGANQAFDFTPAGELRAYNDALCVGLDGGLTAPGTRSVLAACTGQADQTWKLDAGAIRHVKSGLVLDVKGQRTANQTPVIAWTPNGQANQMWSQSAAADTQPPTSPTGLSLSGVTCTSAQLSWQAAADNVGVAFYDIFHDGQLITSVPGSSLSATLTVKAGVPWSLYVDARDAAGNVSQGSAPVPITPPQCQVDTTPPTAPTQLTGTVNGTSVNLSWQAATDNVGVIAYDALRNGAKIGTVAGQPPGTTFVDSGLPLRTPLTYTVQARDAHGNVSPASNTLSLTSGGACSTPICAVSQIANETDIPWGLVNMPDGTLLYAERDAQHIIHLDPASGVKTDLGLVPNVQGTNGEGGLLGLEVFPSFASDRWLYIMHTSPTDNRVVRMQLTPQYQLQTSTEQVLVQGILRNTFHNGGRLRAGPDGKLYASCGDAQNGANAQDPKGLNGKILRINPDGSVPSDNPFGNYVWSLGHRNPQGIAFDSLGRLWEQEFGNAQLDETNLIVKGGNYGWPDCEGTISQSGAGCATPGFIAPKHTYPTADGSCSGLAIVRNEVYVACERGARLYRHDISGADLTNTQTFFQGTYGRLRTVEPTPHGDLYLTTSNTGDKDSIAYNSNEKILTVTLGQ